MPQPISFHRLWKRGQSYRQLLLAIWNGLQLSYSVLEAGGQRTTTRCTHSYFLQPLKVKKTSSLR